MTEGIFVLFFNESKVIKSEKVERERLLKCTNRTDKIKGTTNTRTSSDKRLTRHYLEQLYTDKAPTKIRLQVTRGKRTNRKVGKVNTVNITRR